MFARQCSTTVLLPASDLWADTAVVCMFVSVNVVSTFTNISLLVCCLCWSAKRANILNGASFTASHLVFGDVIYCTSVREFAPLKLDSPLCLYLVLRSCLVEGPRSKSSFKVLTNILYVSGFQPLG